VQISFARTEAPLTRGPDVRALLQRLADEYPERLRAAQHADVARIAFHLSIVIREKGTGCTVCDLGGGVGLFSVGAAALGMKAVLVDDFGDQVNTDCDEDALAVHRKHGVRVLSKDVLTDDLGLEPRSLDAVTSFDSMEHWHHSPKAAFHRLLVALKPGGLFFLGVPNCVNLRKRITVPLGIGKWSSMDEWYERETFRGHVREPDVGDLRYIARALALSDVRIFGRNWLGYASRHRWVRALTPLADRVLQPFPSLCSDIYLLGRAQPRRLDGVPPWCSASSRG
jgi:SAM-dependent methyltransferase